MDNLENLYRKSFEDFERKPKADFWDRLAPIIPPKPEPDNGKLWLFLAYCAGLLSMLIMVLGYQFFIVEQSQPFLSALPIHTKTEESKLPEFSTNDIATKETTAPITTFSIPSHQIEIPSKSDNTSDIPFFSKNESITKNAIEKNGKINPVNNSSYTKSEHKSNAPEVVVAGFQDSKVLKEKGVSKKMNIPFLRKNYYPSLQSEKQLFAFRKKRKPKRKTGLRSIIEYSFLGLQYTPISLGTVKIAAHTNGTSFSQNADINRTKGYDISVGIQFKNNWFVQTGFTKHDYNLNHTHRHSISTNYNNAVVLEDGLIHEYTFAGYPIIEPIQQKVEVWNKAEDFQNGTPFLVQSTTQQDLKFSSIYTHIGYRYRLSSRLQIIPKLGVSAAWVEKGKVELKNVDLLDGRQRLINSSIANTNVTTNNLIEGLVSAELVYRYSKRISFTGTPHYRFGFSPFFNNYQRSTKHRFGQLQLGIRIHLH